MNKTSWKKALYVVPGLAAVGLLVFVLLPGPLLVDGGEVMQGPMQVSVDDQGETRCHDRFVVAAPIPGRLMRIELHDGDSVTQGQILAQITPLPQSIRERDEQKARIEAAEALAHEASEHLTHVTEDLALAKLEHQRIEALIKEGACQRKRSSARAIWQSPRATRSQRLAIAPRPRRRRSRSHARASSRRGPVAAPQRSSCRFARRCLAVSCASPTRVSGSSPPAHR